MSDFPEYIIRRILVALDASSQSFAALNEAAEMAAALKAELIGMFVEDVNLLRSANYPFVQSIAIPSGAAEPIDVNRLERELQAQAEQARQALEQAASRCHRPWSFRRVRGFVTAELLEAACNADVVMLGRAGWAGRGAASLGSTAAVLARRAPGAILIVEQSRANRDPVQVLFDALPGAGRVLRTAATYALARGVGLVVFVPAATDEQFAGAVERARQIADHRFRHIQFERLEAASPALLAKAIARAGSGIVMLSGENPLAEGFALLELVSLVRNPMLLIREERLERGNAGAQ